MADSMTQLLSSGPTGTKINIAVLGDGFASADQTAYNNAVDSLLMKGALARDYFAEDRSAFNVYRVNLISVDSGVGVKTYDANGNLINTVTKNTALGIYFNGVWIKCWLEDGPTTAAKLNNALATWVPDHQLVLVLLNHPGSGGSGGHGRATMPLGVAWPTVAHEFGHGLGGFTDEYCGGKIYSGSEPTWVNATIDSNRATLKWRRFVDPNTPIPPGTCVGYTAGPRPASWDDNQDVGLFEGAQAKYNRAIYRPVNRCRMNTNYPPYCPVCYTAMKQQNDSKTGHTFLHCYMGDFSGDGKDDLLVHYGQSISIFRSNGSQLDFVSSAVGSVPGSGSWQFQPHDQFFVADFNGDGKKEVMVFNGVDWSMPCLALLGDDYAGGLKVVVRYDGKLGTWQMGPDDKILVGDFNGNGKADLFIVNTTHWSHKFLAMFASTGVGFNQTALYDDSLPNWPMGINDKHFVGDFNGDGKADLFVVNTTDWSHKWLAMFASDGAHLTQTALYDNTLPGWSMGAHDQHFVGDFNGDGKADLYVFNGDDWANVSLAMLASNGTTLSMTKLYNGSVPGWQMAQGDGHLVADVNADGKADLVVWNYTHWPTKYLGVMTSTVNGLAATYGQDKIGEWPLGTADGMAVCNYEGGAGRRGLLVHNARLAGPYALHAGTYAPEDLLPFHP